MKNVKKMPTKIARPKCPVEPRKPYAPTKPSIPQKEIEGYERLAVINLGNYDSFTYNDFLEQLKVVGKDPAKLHISIECEVEPGYYDDVTAKAIIIVQEAKMIPNPSYTHMKRYEKAKAKYDKDLLIYKDKLEAYKEALPAWRAYRTGCDIAYLENQLAKLKKESK